MELKTRILFMGAATGWTLTALLFLLLSGKQKPVLTRKPVFVLEPLFPAGRLLRKTLHLPDRQENNRLRKLLEFNSPAEARDIARNASAASGTYWLMLMPVLLMVFALSGSVGLFLLELALLVFLSVLFDLWLDRELKKRHDAFRTEFPSMLTELALMVGAGIPASSALDRVSLASDGLLYQELRRSVENQKNGMTAEQALEELSTRVPLREMRKFISLYRQNQVKGGPDFALLLDEMAAGAWVQRKNHARAQGELAEQKLLIPTVLMFIGILLIVIVPAFRNIL